MTDEKAIQMIKALIDISIKRGIFENIDAAIEMSNAFNHIAEKILFKDNEQ